MTRYSFVTTTVAERGARSDTGVDVGAGAAAAVDRRGRADAGRGDRSQSSFKEVGTALHGPPPPACRVESRHVAPSAAAGTADLPTAAERGPSTYDTGVRFDDDAVPPWDRRCYWRDRRPQQGVGQCGTSHLTTWAPGPKAPGTRRRAPPTRGPSAPRGSVGDALAGPTTTPADGPRQPLTASAARGRWHRDRDRSPRGRRLAR